MSKQLSASALQIQEKRERKVAMLGLAQNITQTQILKAVEDHKNANEHVILTLVQKEGIPKRAFLNEYISEIFDVKVETAQQYFREQRDRLNPMFKEFKKDRKPFFHLASRILEPMVKNAFNRGKKPKGVKKP